MMIRKKRDFTITIIIDIVFVNQSKHFPDEHPKGPRITGSVEYIASVIASGELLNE